MAKRSDAGGWSAIVRGNVLAVGLVSLFTDLASEMIYPFLPVFIAGLVPLGLAPLYLGLMEGIAETTSSILKLVSGRLSDKLGKRKALVGLGYAVSSLIRPVTALVTAGWQVIGLRFVDRIGKGIRTAPRDALIADAVPAARHGLAFSFHRAMDHTGAVLGPLVALCLLYLLLGEGLWHTTSAQPSATEIEALRWLFAVALLPGLAAIATVLFGVREIAPTSGATSKAERDADTARAADRATPSANAPAAGATADPVAAALPRAALPRRFYGFVASVTLFALGNSSDLFLLFYGKTLFGLGLGGMVALWVGLHLLKIAASLPGGMLADRHGRGPTIVAGWLLYAVIYGLFATVQSEWSYWVLFLLYGVYYGLTEGAEKALVAELTPKEARGGAYGIYHATVGLAALPASALFGVFWSAVGPRIAFGIGATLAACAACSLALLLRRRPAP